MLDCIIIGDSIAVGTHMIYTECETYAKNGINSKQWNIAWPVLSSDAAKTVISLGSNDFGINTKEELEVVRSKIKSGKVYWVLPKKVDSNAAVREVAKSHGDTVIEMTNMQPDNIHPTYLGYANIVKKVKED